ncbi:MAG: OmpA family protein [Bacteroidetes bacterium]|nr:OmpA family protein [Bacteroidota bacterium]
MNSKIALIILSFGVGLTNVLAVAHNSGGVIFHGKILDQRTHASVKAELNIFFDNDFEKEHSESTTGEFSESLDKYGWYIITVNAQGYLEATDTLWILNDNRKEIERNYYLTPVEVGLNVVLSNVYFNFGKTSLTDASDEALDKVVLFLQKNPGITCEISGHTDSDGPADYNIILSQGRAQSVVDYLSSKGIETSRLKAKGYGATKPIDTTNTKIGKAKNRRVEFVIVGITKDNK